jgi:LmbE family N-acetylglucosaminyl deacetylase
MGVAILDKMETEERTSQIMTSASLLAVFAHPDDETFRCGGTLALLAQRGVRVQVLTATRGQAGSCGNPPLCVSVELPAVRENELRCACAALGIQPPILLDYQDGHLSKADPERIVSEILAVVREVRPQMILTYGPDGVSGHPDHIAIGRFASEAFRRTLDVIALHTIAVPHSLAKTLGMTQIHSVPDHSISLTVDVSTVWNAKMSAIRCHRTQLGESPILRASPEKQHLFLGTEHFQRVLYRPDLLVKSQQSNPQTLMNF